jgi:antitoxin FitA
MPIIAIPLMEDRLAKLRTWAEQTGLTPEEFLRQHVEKLLDWRDEQFREAVDYVLQKNAGIYRRLA